MNRRTRAFPSSIRTVGRHARWLCRNLPDSFPNRVTALYYGELVFHGMKNPARAATIRVADARFQKQRSATHAA